MRIEDLTTARGSGDVRVSAKIIWEDCDRPPQTLYFATKEEFADGLTDNLNAFLVACAVPALRYGEQRLRVQGAVCPALRMGVEIALNWIHHWYYPNNHPLPVIEPAAMAHPRQPRTPERAGFFFSGGIDSLAMLRVNRLRFPDNHPWSMKDGFLVYGLELDDPQSFNYVMHSLAEAATPLGVTLIPVYTNLYLDYRDDDAEDDFRFWLYQFGGAALAAVAQAFGRRITVASIACADDIPTLARRGLVQLKPWGSHPLLDPNFSSVDVRVQLDGLTRTRFEKVQLLADWEIALQHIRVCNQQKLYTRDLLNCGRCEKCIRTMLALTAVGALEKTRAFSTTCLTPEQVSSTLSKLDHMYDYYYGEMLPALMDRGRADLARVVETEIRRSAHPPLIKRTRHALRSLKRRLRKFRRGAD